MLITMTRTLMNVLFCGVLCLMGRTVSPVNSQLMLAAVTPNQNIELIGGKVPSEGNVLITTEGEAERRYVCDDDFSIREANIVCQELGFVRALRFTRHDFFKTISNPKWTVDSWMSTKILRCFGSNVTRIQDCVLNDNFQAKCTSSLEVAGVVCQTDGDVHDCEIDQFVCEETQSSNSSCANTRDMCDDIPDCPDGSDEKPELCIEEGIYRLVSVVDTPLPESSVAGTVYMKYKQRYGTVCDDGFDQREAQVICRGLGYGSGWSIPYTGAYFGSGSGGIGVDTNDCLGSETSLSHCPKFNWNEHDCTHSEDSGVFCFDGTLEVQLLDGRTPASGRLEIKSSSLSYSAAICGAGFDDLDAQVVCRMLGYNSPEDAKGDKNTPFGAGTGAVWNIILDCLGTESSIEECRVIISNNTCTHQNTAAVTCTSTTSIEALLSQVLPANCGENVDSSDRFITSLGKVRGGKIPSRFDTPWLAALRYRTPGGYEHDCGAVIISEFYLLTAAHCFQEAGRLSYIVSVGDFNNNFNELTQQDFFIDKLLVHENFEELSFGDNDIALIKIESKNGRGMRVGERVQAVCLPKPGEDYDELRSCTVTGWGRTRTSVPPPELPRSAKLEGPLFERSCTQFYGSRRYMSSMACFGGVFINACKGDSGSPMTCLGPQQRHVLYGLVSVGRRCVEGSIHPGIYVRVTKYLRWIQETIYQNQRQG